MTDPTGPGITMRHFSGTYLLGLAILAAAPPGHLMAQSIEGSKWTIEQEGIETPVLWWLGSQGRVRTGDIGAILPGYKWRQAGDSVIVTVGDTMRFAGVIMSNRLVGVRSGPRRQEGWWSGARADGPTAVAVVATSPQAPAVVAQNPGTEQMSRPADQPTASTTTPPRQLRRIERNDGNAAPQAPAAAPTSGDGREIRRLPRPGARALGSDGDLAPTTPIPSAALVGKWVRADSGGMIDQFEAKADGTVLLLLRTGGKKTGQWSNGTDGTRIVFGGPAGDAALRLWMEGDEVRLVVTTATGTRRTWHFRRQG